MKINFEDVGEVQPSKFESVLADPSGNPGYWVGIATRGVMIMASSEDPAQLARVRELDQAIRTVGVTNPSHLPTLRS